MIAAVGDQFAGNFADVLRQRHREKNQRRENQNAANDGGERSVFPKLPRECCEHQQRGARGQANQQPLALLRADPWNENDAEADAAQNPADRVRRVDAADEPRRVLPARRRRRQRERKTRAPQKRRRQQSPEAARHVQLKIQPRIRSQRRINRPIRQRFGQHVEPSRKSPPSKKTGTSRAEFRAADFCGRAPSRRRCRCPARKETRPG